MQDSTLRYYILVEGAEKGASKFELVGNAAKKAAASVSGAGGAAGGASNQINKLGDSTDKAAAATDRAAKAQRNYFAHIAATTVQSALINQLFLQFVDVAGQAVKQVDLMNNFPVTMASMGQSTKDARDSMSSLAEYVGMVGGNLGDATSMVTRFTGATKDVKAATAIFVGLNNALIAGDSSMEEQRLAAIQFAQALERGKPDMREWMSLTQNMSFQLSQVAEEMGYVNANALGEALRSGEVSMADFTTKLTEMSTGTGDIAQQAMARMSGMQFTFNVMKNTLVQGLAAIINAFGRSNIVSFFTFLTQVIQVLAHAVVTLINLFISLINVIRGLFGMSAIGLKKDVEAAAGAGGDLKDNLKDSNDEAKELKKQLAGFDKMNVLADKESGKKKDNDAGLGAGFDAGNVGDLGDIFGDITGGIKEASIWAKIFAGIIGGIMAWRAVKFIWNLAGTILSNIKDVWKWVKDTYTAIVNLIRLGWTTLVENAKQFWLQIRAWADVQWKKITKALDEIWTKAKEIARVSWEKTKAGLNRVKDAAIEAGKKIRDIAKQAATTAIEAGKHAAKTAAAWVKAAATAVAAWLKNMARIALSFITPVVAAIVNAALVAGAWIAGAAAATAAWIVANAAMIGMWALIIIAVAAVVYLIIKYWDEIKDAAIKVWNKITEAVSDAIDWVKNNWPLILAILTGPIGMAVYMIVKHWDTIKKAFSDAWDFIKSVWDLVVDYFQAVWDGIVFVFSAIGGWFKTKFTEAWDGIKAVWSNPGKFFQEKWDSIKQVFSNIKNWFADKFRDAWDGIKSAFGGVSGWFRENVVDKIVTAFNGIKDRIGSFFSGVWDGIGQNLKNTINNILRLPLAIPSIEVAGKRIGGQTLIPRLARGGVVERATTAIIGEAGAEAVIPLENNTEFLDMLADRLGGNGNQPLEITIQIGEDKIATKVIDLINNRTQMSGRNAIYV